MAELSREEVLEIVRVARKMGKRADLGGVDLSAVNLKGADLIWAHLHKANLSMANLNKADLIGANLIQAHLNGADLRRADLTGVFLMGANLSEAKLSGAHLHKANLSVANLRQTHLSQTNLSEANLSEAHLSEANLMAANLTGANLTGANLTGAIVGWTVFGDTNLTKVKGLETVKHVGPSIIGIDMLFNPKGQIPEVFLRDAGVPHELINYLEKVKTLECPYTAEQLDEWIKNLQKQLTNVRRNLHDRKEVQVLHGPLNSPLSLNNEIRELEKEQGTIETQIAEYQRLRTLYYPSAKLKE